MTGALLRSAQPVRSLGEPHQTVADERGAGVADTIDLPKLTVRGGEKSLEPAEAVEQSRGQRRGKPLDQQQLAHAPRREPLLETGEAERARDAIEIDDLRIDKVCEPIERHDLAGHLRLDY